MTNKSPAVEQWFEKLEHPLKSEMLQVRQAILEADERITETVKWSTPTFEYKGNIASFQPKAKQFVSLMFHRGSEIPGNHPHLEGDAALARVMRFRDQNAIEERRQALQDVMRAWCDMQDA